MNSREQLMREERERVVAARKTMPLDERQVVALEDIADTLHRLISVINSFPRQ